MRRITRIGLFVSCALFLWWGGALAQAEVVTQTVTNGPGSRIELIGPTDPSGSYQWFKNGFAVRNSEHIQGAQSSRLTIMYSFSGDEGTYVLLSGESGTETTAVYELHIETLISSVTVPPGGTIHLTGGAGGEQYQWFKDGTELEDTWDTDRITGSESHELIIKGATESDSGTYWLQCQAGLTVFDFGTNSLFVVSVVDIPPSIPPVIDHFFVLTGPNSVNFEVQASGSAPLYYQWYWQGRMIAGATSSTLVYDPADTSANAGYYSVRVWNAYGQDQSPPPGLLFTKTAPPGTYQGIFFDEDGPTPASSGAFQFTLSGSKRSFSGKVTIAKSSYRFSGTLGEDHACRVTTATGPNGRPLTLSLQLLTTDNLPAVTGTIGNANWVVPLRGNRLPYNSKNAAPQQGRYTLALQSADIWPAGTIPDGNGVASLLVGKSGGVSVSGNAADGTVISSSYSLSKLGEWPLYVPLHQNRGLLIGWLTMTNVATGSIQGESIHWVKGPVAGTLYPDGFQMRLEAVGSRFSTTEEVRPWPLTPKADVIPFTHGVATLGAGDMLANDLAVWTFINFSVPTPNKFRVEATPENLQLHVTTKTGKISGSFVNFVTGRRTPIRGIILQEQAGALGYFLSGESSGYFSLSEAEAP